LLIRKRQEFYVRRWHTTTMRAYWLLVACSNHMCVTAQMVDCVAAIYRSTMRPVTEPTWYFLAFCERCERNFRFIGQCRCKGSVAECRRTCPKCEQWIFCNTGTTSVAALSPGQPNISEPEGSKRAITSTDQGKGRHSTFVETADGR